MNQLLGALNRIAAFLDRIAAFLDRIAAFLELQALRAGEADHLLREGEKKSRVENLTWYLWMAEKEK